MFLNGDQNWNDSNSVTRQHFNNNGYRFHIIHTFRSNTTYGTSFQYSLNSYFAGRQFKGKIAELISFDGELTAEDRIAITLYLAQKWGLTHISDSDDDGVLDNVDTKPKDPSVQ